MPLYAAWVQDLGPDDVAVFRCGACGATLPTLQNMKDPTMLSRQSFNIRAVCAAIGSLFMLALPSSAGGSELAYRYVEACFSNPNREWPT